MKSIMITLLTLFLCQPSWAQAWKQNGATWTSATGCVVTVPAALKATVTKEGNLNAENDAILAMMIPIANSDAIEPVMARLEQEMGKQFKGIKFGPAKSAAENGMTVTIKEGTVTQDGESILITLGQFVKGHSKVGVMTVQKADDKAGDELLSKMMSTVDFK